MKLTAHERRQLRQALVSAIQWEDSLAQAHYTAFPKRYTGIQPKIVPPEYRDIVARCRRRIASYRRLIEKMQPTSTRNASK